MLVKCAALAGACLATSAHAGVTLIAKGALTGSSAGAYSDLSGLTGVLENGARANLLGGLGSGLAYAGHGVFVATPDRGPNATAYNAAVDNTTSYISRLQTMQMDLTASAPGSALPFSLTPALTGTTLFFSSSPLTYGSGAGLGTQIDGTTPIGSGAPALNTSDKLYFTGRSDNFGPGGSGNPTDARFDPEGVRVSNDGATVYVSDEYGPYVRAFDRATGKLLKTYALPGNLDVANLAPTGDQEISGNTSGRVANKGMEGLALTPDGKTLVGIMQAPLIQDAADTATKNMLRIVTIDVATGQTQEFGYMLTKGSGVSEIVAINAHQFLVDERDGKGLGDGTAAKVKQLYQIDTQGAVDITGKSGTAAAAAAVPKSATPFLDIVSALVAAGLPASQIPAKIEGLAFGQDVVLNGQTLHTLYVSNDNDFVADASGPNQFFVFGFSDADLPGYQAQAFAAAPEPAGWALMILGFGAAGTVLRRRVHGPALG
jgi:hypothetical protein